LRLLSFRHEDSDSYGLLTNAGIVDLKKHLGRQAPTLKALLARGALPRAAEFAHATPDYDPDAIELLPVIPDPAHIICIGLNYEEHRAETARPVAAYPTIFLRTIGSLQAANSPLLIPRESEQFDYEGELAVVIGRGGRRIDEESAWAHIAGVSGFNDATVRDWQYHTHQFGPGKNFPLTGALGPVLLTCDELPANKTVRIETRLNGQVMQQAHTGQMIFTVPRLIAYISTFMTLMPGDVIATGTPGGVGAKRKPPVWMRAGDTVTVEIEGVGLLSNPCVKET
jgi:2-keto-4-pentenoate hydratase/2-oxohepta-3-ene-1,7-dioic acid hydratase in catechol pathway